jgi:hypothetical protein
MSKPDVDAPSHASQSIRDRVLRRLIGTPGDFIDRLIALAIIACAGVLTVALYFVLARGVDPRATSSFPYVRIILWVAFNEWTYVLVFVLLARRLLIFKDSLRASVAAAKTGFEAKTIRRLAEEVKSATGGTVVLVESEDSHEEICNRIESKLDGGSDDDFTDLHATTETEGQAPPALSREGEIHRELDNIEDELDELYEKADELADEALDSTLSPEAILEADEVASLYELMEADDREHVDELEDVIDEIDAVETRREEKIDELAAAIDESTVEDDGASGDVPDRVGDELEVEESSKVSWPRGVIGRLPGAVQYALGVSVSAMTFGGSVVAAETFAGLASDLYYNEVVVFILAVILGLAIGLIGTWLLRGAMKAHDADSTDDDDGDVNVNIDGEDDGGAGADDGRGRLDDHLVDEGAVDPYAEEPWSRHWQETRLKLSTHLSLPEIAWNVGIPAATIFGALVVAGGIWVQWWAALGAGALGLLVGLLNWRRVHAQRERKLKQYRREFEGEEDNLIGFQVKHVETPETERYIAYFPRHTYATDTREEFVIEVAQRAYEKANGLSMSPSILEKYARQDGEMMPAIDDYHDQELGDIMWWLIQEVSNAEIGIVSKQKLIEDCVEHDIDQRWHQRYRSGYGYDPRLVRQAYRLLVDAEFFSEEEVVLEKTDDNGDPLVETGVVQRYDPVPVHAQDVRAQFTTEFANYAQWTPLYEMPDVDDLLERPPMLADKAGPAAEPIDDVSSRADIVADQQRSDSMAD